MYTQAAETPAAPLAANDAPFIFFDCAPAFGLTGGVLGITLEAVRMMLVDGKIKTDRVATAHLRMSLTAALNLRGALDGAILAAAPHCGETN